MLDRLTVNFRYLRSRVWRRWWAKAPTRHQLARATLEKTRATLQWLWTLLLAPVYISFEVYIAAWAFWVRRTHLNAGLQADGWQRGLFCLVLSLALGQLFLLMLIQTAACTWSVLICGLHGVAVHVLWKKGRRWCKQQLGIRPERSTDPNRPLDGLDLGN